MSFESAITAPAVARDPSSDHLPVRMVGPSQPYTTFGTEPRGAALARPLKGAERAAFFAELRRKANARLATFG